MAGPDAPHTTSIVDFARGVRVDRPSGEIRIDAVVVLREGFLEQLACTPSTRVHESLIAVEASPRSVHAAMLLVGIEPGSPGSWREVTGTDGAWSVERVRPTGQAVDVIVRWVGPDGAAVERPIGEWVRRTTEALPGRFVFAGSHLRPNTPSMGPGEHYVADLKGSVVGLVTFGDEVIAYDDVISDRVDVDAPAWEAWTDRIPPEGTPIELLIRASGSRR